MPSKKRRDAYRSSLIRVCRKLVFIALKALNSIGDYKHVQVERYASAYTITTQAVKDVMTMLNISHTFTWEELMCLYMNRQRMRPLCISDTQCDEYLTERNGTSIGKVIKFSHHNRAVRPVMEMALSMCKADTTAPPIIKDLLGRMSFN